MQKLKSVRVENIQDLGIAKIHGERSVYYIEDRFPDTTVFVRGSVKFTRPNREAVVVDPQADSAFALIEQVRRWKQG